MAKKSFWPLIKEPLILAFTAIICLYLAQWLSLPQGYWAVMSAMIVMQASAKETINASSNRVIGTAVGAVIGGAFLYLWGAHVWVFGLGVMLVVLVCMLFNLKQSYRLAAVTVAIILLVSHPESPWLTAWHRFLEVTLGVMVALVISLMTDRLIK